MKHVYYSCLLIIAAFFAPYISLGAQTAVSTLPFVEGFENARAESEWVLNNGPFGKSLQNKWCVSEVEHYLGSQSLVISDDGATASYTNDKKSYAVAYREFALPVGEYDLQFSWKGGGEKDLDGLLVCWLPATFDIKSGVMAFDKTALSNQVTLDGKLDGLLYGNGLWTISSGRVMVSTPGVNYRLYFIWGNNDTGGDGISVSVDNVILSATDCPEPQNFTTAMRGADIELNWTGSASDYEVMMRWTDATGAVGVDTVGVNQTQFTIENVGERICDFYVRSVCAGGKRSPWTFIGNRLVFPADARCFDFTDIHGKDVSCTMGTLDNPYAVKGILDKGNADWEGSRHTLHYAGGETDPYTGGGLKTVPDGELVSVRLGNSSHGKEAESITYTYDIGQNEHIIMMVKYAVVYESPGADHTKAEMPRFTLEILDEEDNLLEADLCNEVEFYPPENYKPGSSVAPEGWNHFDGRALGKIDILWKDWESVGVNLTKYSGMTIKIRFTTYDCGKGQHFAHAFFTISCMEAELSGWSCGAKVDSVVAPANFDYRWYRDGTEKIDDVPVEVLSSDSVFRVKEGESGLYYCDVMFKGRSKCFFTLPAHLIPREPVAAFSVQWQPEGCNNSLRLENTGGVKIDGKLDAGERCDSILWEITNVETGDIMIFTSDDVSLPVPDEGGVYDIRLTVGINDNECVDVELIEGYVVPSIGNVEYTIDSTICSGTKGVYFNGEWRNETGEYRFDGKVQTTGCDSTVILKLEVSDEVEVEELSCTICKGDTVYIGSGTIPYTRTGVYRGKQKNSAGCDVDVVLNLTVQEVELNLPDNVPVCADTRMLAVPFEVITNSFEESTYDLQYDAKAVEAGFSDKSGLPIETDSLYIAIPDSVRPDFYAVDVLMNDTLCGPHVATLNFIVQYPHTVMKQKWNDVVALYNETHGGYDYDSYQWYRNGKPITGATGSYLYVGSDGGEFVVGDEISVSLSREGEDYEIMSCPIKPDGVGRDETEYIEVRAVYAGQRVTLSGVKCAGEAQWFAISGQLVGCEEIEIGKDSITAPSLCGVYLLRLVLAEDVRTYKIVVN